MAVEVTAAELNEVLLDADVQALIVQKLAEKKTAGLADALTAQYKSLGIEPAVTEPASADNTADDSSSAVETAAGDEVAA